MPHTDPSNVERRERRERDKVQARAAATLDQIRWLTSACNDASMPPAQLHGHAVRISKLCPQAPEIVNKILQGGRLLPRDAAWRMARAVYCIRAIAGEEHQLFTDVVDLFSALHPAMAIFAVDRLNMGRPDYPFEDNAAARPLLDLGARCGHAADLYDFATTLLRQGYPFPTALFQASQDLDPIGYCARAFQPFCKDEFAYLGAGNDLASDQVGGHGAAQTGAAADIQTNSAGAQGPVIARSPITIFPQATTLGSAEMQPSLPGRMTHLPISQSLTSLSSWPEDTPSESGSSVDRWTTRSSLW